MKNDILFKRRETEITLTTKTNETEPRGFRLIFLGKEEEDVEVLEVNEIDFADVKKRLEGGKSIFMATIQPPTYKPELFIETNESWYFSRV